MKKWMSLFLALVLACSLLGCGVQGESTDGMENMGGEKIDVTIENTEGQQQIAVPDYVQAAIDSSNRLTTSRFYLAEDGSVLVNPAYGRWSEEIRKDLLAAVQLPNLMKLLMNGEETEILALTEDGDVYYNGVLLYSGIVDMDCNTMTMVINKQPNNEFIQKDKTGAINFLPESDLQLSMYQRAMEEMPERFMEVDGTTICRHEYELSEYKNTSEKNGYAYAESAKYISAEDRDYLVLGEDGKLYVKELSLDDEINYRGMECFDWENLVWVDSALYDHIASTHHELTLTVAGIQADGTVVACGEYADEILSWGPLSYLSMSEGLIAGLTIDGNARLTGQMAKVLKEEVNTWTNIAGIKVGKLLTANTDIQTDVISAITKDGTFRVCFYDFHDGIFSREFSLDDMGGLGYYRYSPDGNVYLPNSETGEWEIWVPEMEE